MIFANTELEELYYVSRKKCWSQADVLKLLDRETFLQRFVLTSRPQIIQYLGPLFSGILKHCGYCSTELTHSHSRMSLFAKVANTLW